MQLIYSTIYSAKKMNNFKVKSAGTITGFAGNNFPAGSAVADEKSTSSVYRIIFNRLIMLLKKITII